MRSLFEMHFENYLDNPVIFTDIDVQKLKLEAIVAQVLPDVEKKPQSLTTKKALQMTNRLNDLMNQSNSDTKIIRKRSNELKSFVLGMPEIRERVFSAILIERELLAEASKKKQLPREKTELLKIMQTMISQYLDKAIISQTDVTADVNVQEAIFVIPAFKDM